MDEWVTDEWRASWLQLNLGLSAAKLKSEISRGLFYPCAVIDSTLCKAIQKEGVYDGYSRRA